MSLIEFLPGVGVRLGVDEVRFGAPASEVRAVLARHGAPEKAFACRGSTAVAIGVGGVRLTATCDESGELVDVSVRRTEGEAMPVALDGVDLFGHPAADLVDALSLAGHTVRWRPHRKRLSIDRVLWLDHDDAGSVRSASLTGNHPVA